MIFEPKVVLITGSCKGLGREIAKELIGLNYQVITHSRSEVSYVDIGQHKHVFGDLSNESEMNRMCLDLKKDNTKIDYYVCNAGSGSSVTVGSEEKKDWIDSFDKNFYSSVIFLKFVNKHLLQGNEKILTIGSICGSRYIEGAPITYSCSKAALAAFVRNYSVYLSDKNINIVNLELGNMLFDGSSWEVKIQQKPENVNNMLNEKVPLKKFGSPAGITGFIDWYFTAEDQFATGANFTLDGGQTL